MIYFDCYDIFYLFDFVNFNLDKNELIMVVCI